jgi:Zn ribbon nucleic-acid-binding protein
MGSIIDYIECPNCKEEAYNEFYYKSGEEFVFCNSCGYKRSAEIINREKSIDDETNWKYIELVNPYGAYKLKTYNSIYYQSGSFETKKDYDKFLNQIDNDVELEFVSVSQLIGDKVVESIIIQNPLNECDFWDGDESDKIQE